MRAVQAAEGRRQGGGGKGGAGTSTVEHGGRGHGVGQVKGRWEGGMSDGIGERPSPLLPFGPWVLAPVHALLRCMAARCENAREG